MDGVPLTNDPTLLFLHGVGPGDREELWKARLSESLERLGYPPLTKAKTTAPQFSYALKGVDDRDQLPPVTIKQPGRVAARQNRRAFERRIGAVEYRLGRHDAGAGALGGDATINMALAFPKFQQARNYMNDEFIRAHVLKRILASLPESGRIVIVGHSLGSVIAADLLRRLPVGIEVAGMITIGSPLANARFDIDKLRDLLQEPPTNLSWWVNFWNRLDPVSANRGVSSVFPWMLDFRVDTSVNTHTHDAVEYLGDTSVATAIGYALFGSLSKEVASLERGADIPLDPAEHYTLLALRYATLIKDRLQGDVRDRYAGALRQVQATAIHSIIVRNQQIGRAIPAAIARLAFDLSDPDAPVPESIPGAHVPKNQAVVAMTVLAAENIIRPFELDVSKEKRQEALEDLTAEMGLTSQYGAHVFEAAKRAQDVLTGSKAGSWVKWGILGAGAAALVAATGGLALAAAPGLVGAAVVTSALASFGPGGMIGGLLTAGALVSAGGGGIAFGLASPGTTAESLESVVGRQLAAVILRQLQRLEQDPAVWHTLVEIEAEVRREYERLDEFSDDSAPGLKELKRKITAIERALKYMRDNKLEPGAEEPEA